jgi:hypothetical protein
VVPFLIAVGLVVVFLFIVGNASAMTSPTDGANYGPDSLNNLAPVDPQGEVQSTTMDSATLDAKVEQMAAGIAQAEGFYVAGSIPQKAHNPGDLAKGDMGDTGNYIFAKGGVQIIVFLTDDDGWTALKTKIRRMLTNTSKVYNTQMSLSQLAQTYTGGDNPEAWANTLAQNLGVGTDSSLEDFLNA